MILSYTFSLILLTQIALLIWLYWCGTIVRNRQKEYVFNSCETNDIDVIIAAKENSDIIIRTLKSLQHLEVNKIILALDHPSPCLLQKVSVFLSDYPQVTLVTNTDLPGKINTQKKAFINSDAKNILLIDSDITIAIDQIEFEKMYAMFVLNKCDFLCPYSFGIYKQGNLWERIVECDRIMRQQIIRAGRDYYGVSNLSGYCLLAKRDSYLDVIESNCLQDDVVASINLITKKYKVNTYHKVVCGELERFTFYKMLMQRVRWTAGNLLIFWRYCQIFKLDYRKAIVFLASFHFWYGALYVDFLAMICSRNRFIILYCLTIEIILKTVLLSVRAHGIYNITTCFAYSIIWPSYSILALCGVIPFLLFRLEKESRR